MLRSSSFDGETETLIDFRYLFKVTRGRRREYLDATPFPNLVIDDFLPKSTFDEVHRCFTLPSETVRFEDYSANLEDGSPAQAGKIHLSSVMEMHPVVRNLVFEMCSFSFLKALQRITGIRGLLPDPLLQGGGIHLVKRGGLLRVHADFNRHDRYRLDRRVNLLLYFNPDWKESYGGHLELWTKDMGRCEKRILPIANRCVIFSTTSHSFHGHPHPLTCPENVMRKSISLYYYSIGRPATEVQPAHNTLWQRLPSEQGSHD